MEDHGTQLDLFLNNRRTILVNAANEHLRNLELEQAAALYDRLLTEAADDPAIISAKQVVEAWRRRLELFHSSSPGIDRIHSLYQSLSEPAPASLEVGVRFFIMECLERVDSPELIFIPPRFHLGCLLLEIGKTEKAETWFLLALDSGIPERGRFLAYLGDVLVITGDTDAARDCYLAAFLEDPHGIDLGHLRDQDVREMIIDIEEEEVAGEEAVCWVPVWGWLKGIFGLESSVIDGKRKLDSESLTTDVPFEGNSVPRHWFELLRRAEHLRTEYRNDGELVRVRRMMKELNPLLFSKYMEKVRG
jgi:tetratricopeptide (TPR) repeat protein